MISQFVIPANSGFCFTWFWRIKKKIGFFLIFFIWKNFGIFFLKIFIHIFFVWNDCHLINIKISLVGMTITRNSVYMEIWIGEKKIKISRNKNRRFHWISGCRELKIIGPHGVLGMGTYTGFGHTKAKFLIHCDPNSNPNPKK